MGKGSTKNERKSNPQRLDSARGRELAARRALDELLKLPVNQRTADHARLVNTQRGILNKARSQQKRSENDTQSGKRGRK